MRPYTPIYALAVCAAVSGPMAVAGAALRSTQGPIRATVVCVSITSTTTTTSVP